MFVTHILKVRALIVAMILALINTASAASSYIINDIGLLPGGTFSSATAINAHGEVVGYAELADGTIHAFLYTGERMNDIGSLNGRYSDSYAYDINDAGVIIGESVMDDGNHRGFRYMDGKMQVLQVPGTLYSSAWGLNGAGMVVGDGEIMYDHMSSDITAFLDYRNKPINLGRLPGGTFSSATALNDRSQVVGISNTTDDYGHPFLWENYVMNDLGTLGGRYAGATSINNNGQIVGYSELSNGDQHAFFYADGVMSDLGTLGGATGEIALSYAHSINANGQVVGSSTVENGATHAFLYSNGAMVDLNTLIPPDSGWELVEALDINDAGQIVGHGYKAGAGSVRAFLLTPVTAD